MTSITHNDRLSPLTDNEVEEEEVRPTLRKYFIEDGSVIVDKYMPFDNLNLCVDYLLSKDEPKPVAAAGKRVIKLKRTLSDRAKEALSRRRLKNSE